MVQRLDDEARVINRARGLPEGPKVPDGRSICVRNIVFERQLHGWLDCDDLPQTRPQREWKCFSSP
jgi:hypothetical protein